MDVKRLALVAAAGGSLAVWFAAAATSSHRGAVDVPAATSGPVDLQGEALAEEIARLHDRLRPTAAPRLDRNLFRFSEAGRPAASSVRARPAPARLEAAEPPDRPLPALKLIGIAENDGPDGVVRTAIISRPGELLFAKEGDPATTRYRVVRIAGDVVELADTIDGSLLRLALQ
jgi:hypothetical protein